MASLSGYAYRKKCTVIATAAGAQTDYQLDLIVGESSGAAGEDVDCESHCEDFPNDIRFTKEDGETKHDYWVDSTSLTGITPNRQVRVWIEVASIPASGTVDFYIYYGKSADDGESSGGETFEFFDDATSYHSEIHHNIVSEKPHGSTCIKLANDDLLHAFHSGASLQIPVYKSTDNGDTWSLLSTPWLSNFKWPDLVSSGTTVWIVGSYGGTAVKTKKSTDSGATWGSGIAVADGEDPAISYINSNLLLIALVDNSAATNYIKIYKSTDNGDSWAFVTNATSFAAAEYEDLEMDIAPNGDIVLAYEKEWAEGGHGGVYCVRSTDDGDTWGGEITILDDGSSDNEGPCLLVDGSDIYAFVPTDEDAGGGSYRDNIVKRLKSSDNGATWGAKTIVMDTTFTTEVCVVKTANSKVLLFGGRRYPNNWYIFQVEIDMETPKRFASKWTQDQGLIYCKEDGGDKCLFVESWVAAGKKAFVVDNLNIANFVMECDIKCKGSVIDMRSAFRYQDINNHYLSTLTGDSKIYKRVGGAYTALDTVAWTGALDTWYAYKIQCNGTSIKTWVDNVLKNDDTDATYATGKTGLSNSEFADRIPSAYKKYRVRQYVSPEPTWGTWQSERKLLSGSISAATSVTGTCSASWKLSGIISSGSSLLGSLSRDRPFSGTITSSASVFGSLFKYVALTGSLGASSSVSGTASMQWSLKGAISATSSVSGSLSMLWSLKGDVSAASSVSAAASVAWSLKGSITAISSVSGSIIEHTYLAGSLSASSVLSGTLTSFGFMAGSISAISSLEGLVLHIAPDRGFYYAKLGSTILTALEKDSFRITEELNKIPSFEFEIANCSDNRTTIAAGITDVLTIYRRTNDVDTLMFTGIINGDAIEYLSLERIRITGYASYIDLNWRFHQHLNSADVEVVGKCFVYNGSYTDKTAEANNDAINDVTITFTSVNDAIYLGQNETFFGMQVKYSTKGVQAVNTTVVWEYSEGSSVWSTLDILDETRQFTQDVGTYYITIPHKPSDWAKETVNSIKKFWVRARLTAGSYTTQPKLDRIKMTNTDVYRVYYFDTAADTIMDEVLDGTGYSMDVTDACPSDIISIVAEYETKLRMIPGVANALTWDDGGDKKGYQWWVTDADKKVHFKQKRGSILGDITADLTILNNIEDYFNLSNRLHFFGNYDGLNQLKAVIENTSSQDTHEIRELAVPDERYNNYIPLKEAASKAMTYSKAPLQKITATVDTKYWINNAFEVGDTVTLHKDTWNVASSAFQIVRADIGPRVTNIDMGISQEHLDGLKAGLQRQLDITGIRMHGSTSIFQIGPLNENYHRVNAGTVYPSRLKIEIPADVRYIHKVLLSWKIEKYKSSVEGGGETAGHDHTGAAGAGGAFTPAVSDGGAHTPTELSKAHTHDLDGTLKIPHSSNIRWFPVASAQYESAVQGLNHHHSNPSMGSSDSNMNACTSIGYGSSCTSGACVDAASTYFHSVALAGHSHSQGNTGDTNPTAYIDLIEHNVVTAISDYVISIPSQVESPAHAHTINAVVDHPHAGVAEPAHSDHIIVTEAAADVDLTYGVYEEAAGTLLELIINGETVGSSYSGDQTDIVISGFLTTGSNTVLLQPVSSEVGKKGSATFIGTGLVFIEAKKW